MKIGLLSCVLVLFLSGGLCNDADVISELMNCTSQPWCTSSDPCSGCTNFIKCSGDRITKILGDRKRLTCLPESIGSLVRLTWL